MSDINRWNELIKQTSTESDRSYVLIIAANIDNRLRDILNNFFVDSKESKELFENSGPLSTFSARNNLAYSLGLIAKNESHDINIIRKIRNDFAHKEDDISFSNQRITSFCCAFELSNNLKKQHEEMLKTNTKPKDMFAYTAFSLSLLLTARLKDASSQKRQVFPNTSILPKK